MLIKIDVKSELSKRIQKLIDSGKYDDIYQFVKIALNNQIQEESSGITPNLETSIITKSDEIPETAEEKQDEVLKHLWNFSAQKNEYKPEVEEMICPFYTRFFPVKVIIHKLASMLSANKPWIEIRELQEEAYIFAEKVSEKLRDIEQEKQLPRNKKLSTGLPMPKSEIVGLKGNKKRLKVEKHQSSKSRFKEQFVGKRKTKEPYFKGACFSMGLIAVEYTGEICYVSLTEDGKNFAVIDNPILDENNFQHSFSDQEMKFIFNTIYPKFPSENKITHKIIDALKEKSLVPDDINQIFKNEGMKDFRAERVSTMGKLSELQILDWKITKEGKSVYKLNKEKAQQLGL